MKLTSGIRLSTESKQFAHPAAIETHSRLNIAVVFTAIESTLSALKQAGVLAGQLHGSITLVVPQVVPFPLPLTRPHVSTDWNERRFQVIASGICVKTTVRIYACRDRLETLIQVLAPHSIVLLGGRKRWLLPTPEERLAGELRQAGHEVIFIEIP